ncbi:FlgB family protein [Sulfitobacter sp. LCG007]
MFDRLDVFKMSYAMAVHAGHRQAVVAQNVANADTPGYQARDVASFSDSFRSTALSAGQVQKATRPGHLNGASSAVPASATVDRDAEASPNGNTVSLEMEMLKSIDAKRSHDRALAIYKSSLNILRLNLAR